MNNHETLPERIRISEGSHSIVITNTEQGLVSKIPKEGSGKESLMEDITLSNLLNPDNDIPGFPKVIHLDTEHENLTMKYYQPLCTIADSKMVWNEKLTVEDKLNIAYQLANTLDYLSKFGLTPFDLAPWHIGYDKEEGVMAIFDKGFWYVDTSAPLGKLTLNTLQEANPNRKIAPQVSTNDHFTHPFILRQRSNGGLEGDVSQDDILLHKLRDILGHPKLESNYETVDLSKNPTQRLLQYQLSIIVYSMFTGKPPTFTINGLEPENAPVHEKSRTGFANARMIATYLEHNLYVLQKKTGVEREITTRKLNLRNLDHIDQIEEITQIRRLAASIALEPTNWMLTSSLTNLSVPAETLNVLNQVVHMDPYGYKSSKDLILAVMDSMGRTIDTQQFDNKFTSATQNRLKAFEAE